MKGGVGRVFTFFLTLISRKCKIIESDKNKNNFKYINIYIYNILKVIRKKNEFQYSKAIIVLLYDNIY